MYDYRIYYSQITYPKTKFGGNSTSLGNKKKTLKWFCIGVQLNYAENTVLGIEREGIRKVYEQNIFCKKTTLNPV